MNFKWKSVVPSEGMTGMGPGCPDLALGEMRMYRVKFIATGIILMVARNIKICNGILLGVLFSCFAGAYQVGG
jgi:hypothetical protein